MEWWSSFQLKIRNFIEYGFLIWRRSPWTFVCRFYCRISNYCRSLSWLWKWFLYHLNLSSCTHIRCNIWIINNWNWFTDPNFLMERNFIINLSAIRWLHCFVISIKFIDKIFPIFAFLSLLAILFRLAFPSFFTSISTWESGLYSLFVNLFDKILCLELFLVYFCLIMLSMSVELWFEHHIKAIRIDIWHLHDCSVWRSMLFRFESLSWLWISENLFNYLI